LEVDDTLLTRNELLANSGANLVLSKSWSGKDKRIWPEAAREEIICCGDEY
jgi:hypothetical protein